MIPRVWNTIENVLIAVVTLLIINFLIIRPLRNDLNEMRESLTEIAMQPKYSITNDFEKMRTKQNGSIVLDLNNELNPMELRPMDTLAVEEPKKSFINRLFRKGCN